MFHWVNNHQLPFAGLKPQLIKLISDLFGGVMIPVGKSVWDPNVNDKKLSRILLMGKAVTGTETEMKPKDTDNEFDIDAGGGHEERE